MIFLTPKPTQSFFSTVYKVKKFFAEKKFFLKKKCNGGLNKNEKKAF